MVLYTVCHSINGIEVVVSIHNNWDDAETAAGIFRTNAEESGADRSYYVKERWCSVR